MAPHKPQRYAGPVEKEEQLSTALQSAKPDWSARELAMATNKLSTIGIESIDELAQALAEGLNTRIKTAGLKTFGSETIIELKKVISTKYSALVSQRELEEVRAKKQAALEEENFLEASTFREREKELLEEVEALALPEDDAGDRRRVLELELSSIRTLKCAAVKAEDYTGAETLRQREVELLARTDALREEGERLRRQRRALRTELASVRAEVAAAISAEEYEFAHAASQRRDRLTVQLEGVESQLPESDGEELGSEPAIDEAPEAPPALAAEAHEPPAPPRAAATPARTAAAPPHAAAAPPRAAAAPPRAAAAAPPRATAAEAVVAEAGAEDTDGARDPQQRERGGGRKGRRAVEPLCEAGAGGPLALELEVCKPAAEPDAAEGPETDDAQQALVSALDSDLEDSDEEQLPALDDDECAAEPGGPPEEEKEEGLPAIDEEDEEEAEPPEVPAQPRWKIVGGHERHGGIMVRQGESKTSPPYPERLSTGAEVEEIEVVGDRLHYRRLTGTGPEEGWISTRANQKVLARRLDELEEESSTEPLAAIADAPPPSNPGGARSSPDAEALAAQASPATPALGARRSSAFERAMGAQRSEPAAPAPATGARRSEPAAPAPPRSSPFERAMGVARGEPAAPSLPELQEEEDIPAASSSAPAAVATPEPVQISAALRNRAELAGVPVDKLEDLSRAEALVERVERLNKKTSRGLHAECEQLGIATDDLMSRAELSNLVRNVILWGELSAPALREECVERGYEVDAQVEKEELLQLLRQSTWEGMGVPISRLPDVAAAQKVLQHLRELEGKTEVDLWVHCADYGLSTEGSTEKMREHLRRAYIWDALSLPELRREAAAYSVEVPAPAPGSPPKDEEALRSDLLEGLRVALVCDPYQARGVPVERLGQERADQVLAQLDRLQDLSLTSLRAECRKQDLDFEAGMDAQAVVEQLRGALVLKHLPEEAFKDECLKFDVQYTRSRTTAIARLLERHRRAREWKAQGIPDSLFQDSETAETLSLQLQTVQDMTDTQLWEWYVTDMGCPEEKAIERAELLELCKKITLCESLPLEDLRQSCASWGMDVDAGGEDEPREALLDRLVEHDRMVKWNDRGFQALRINDYDAVLRMVSKFEEFVGMSDEELASQCSDFGVCLDAGADRKELLMRLKTMMVWEMLPLDELREECAKKGLQVELPQEGERGEADLRAEWIQQLNMEELKQSFERQGLPVGKLSAEEAFNLVMQFQKLDSMSMEELRALKDELIPLPGDAAKEEIVRSFKDWMLLLNLSMPDLVVRGQKLDLPTEGFDLPDPNDESAKAEGEDPNASAATTLRMRLQSRVFLRKRFLDNEEAQKGLPRMLEPSVQNGAGGAVDVKHLPEVWKLVREMRDPFVAEIVCGVPSFSLPSSCKLPAEAKRWPPLDAALYALSGGLFDPQTCNRNTTEYTPEEEAKLISVICPTNHQRRMWHGLLYECFQAQQYEPKELVIIDTGMAPSAKFQEIAKEDKRVVYNFFPVADTKDPRAEAEGKSKTPAWSLGLKRNVACRIARGSVLAHFDDDDLYFPGYLDWFWPRIVKAAGGNACNLGPALAKLSEWHLFDLQNMAFHYMNPLMRKCMPLREQPAALYGWGFSYVFTRRAWELSPFPDVHFAEDAGFVEGLLARNIKVSLLKIPEDSTLVAHTVHSTSTTGGEVSVGQRGLNNPVQTPKEFNGIFQALAQSVRTKAKTRAQLGQGAGRARQAEPPPASGGRRSGAAPKP